MGLMRACALALAAIACAGAAQPPAREERRPIAGAGGWTLQQRLPGVPGIVCTIRSEGPEANMTVVLNNDRRPVLFVGRSDWSGLRGDARVSISIDDASPIVVDAMMLNNLVIVGPLDAEFLRRLGGGQMLEWALPFGRFRARVAGLASAFDALAACTPDPTG